jgi:multisubunit Na+/H+ antiporter MnhE subunit
MEAQSVVMALQLTENVQLTVGERTIWAIPGDVVVDSPDGSRKLFHKIDFDQFVEKHGLQVSGDMGLGWVECRKA